MSVSLLTAYEELTVLAEFLDARSAEDEATARAEWDWMVERHGPGFWTTGEGAPLKEEWTYETDTDASLHVSPRRVLAECKVKRDIAAHLRVAIESYARSLRKLKRSGFDDRDAQESNLVAITTLEVVQCIAEHAALPYTGHPDYNEEWEPAWSVDEDPP